jgi:hypothetical protein
MADHCPDHPEAEPSVGFGLAGGGYGAYIYCPECGHIIEKWQEENDMTTKHADTPSLEATEKVGGAGATHPRITLDYIKSQVQKIYYIDGETLANAANFTDHIDKVAPYPPKLASFTVCMVLMKNGFMLLGKSAPLSPENFDQGKGRIFAYEDALRQTWPLFAFGQLQAKLDDR